MSPHDRPLVWLRGSVKTPPFGPDARIEAGFLLRRLQRGDGLGLPHSRPLSDVGPGCHELRIVDGAANWRIMYHIASEAIVILDVFRKKTPTTPKSVISECARRLAEFRRVMGGKKGVPDARR